ncbi:Nuclease-related domain-containing protein [Gordonia malaquae]|nr:Nuclease-related domain-containing protein [Gordonia malaquae]
MDETTGSAARYGSRRPAEGAFRKALNVSDSVPDRIRRVIVSQTGGTTRRDEIRTHFIAAAGTFVLGVVLFSFVLWFTTVIQGMVVGGRDRSIIGNLFFLVLGLALALAMVPAGLIALRMIFITPFIKAAKGFVSEKTPPTTTFAYVTDDAGPAPTFDYDSAVAMLADDSNAPANEEEAQWWRGAKGEVIVGELLEQLPEGYEVAHDIEILDGRGRVRANIDHIVTGPAGVWMVDAKHWRGYTKVENDGIAGAEYKQNAARITRWEASQIGCDVDGIIIAVVGGKVRRSGVILDGERDDIPVIVTEAQVVNGFLQNHAAGRNESGPPMHEVATRSRTLRFG